MSTDAITQPLDQSTVSQKLGVPSASLVRVRRQLVEGDDWYRDPGPPMRIFYTLSGIEKLKSIFPKANQVPVVLPQSGPQSAIVHSPNQPLYREPELPQWEQESIEYLDAMEPDHQITPWGRNAEIERLRQELSPVQYANPANYPATVNPPSGGIHGGSGGVIIVNGDINYHRSSVRESPKRVAESSFTLTRKQHEMGMYAIVGLILLALIAAMVNMFRPSVIIQQRSPIYEQQRVQ